MGWWWLDRAGEEGEGVNWGSAGGGLCGDAGAPSPCPAAPSPCPAAPSPCPAATAG